MTRAPRRRALQELLDSAGNLAASEPTPVPEDVRAWLGQLSLLYDIPFLHLVADSRMLPDESIRFFNLDPRWVGAAIDGALAVVDVGGLDSALIRALRDSLHDAAARSARSERQMRRTGERNADVEATWDGQPLSGCLLRSALVSAVPGLTITGHPDEAGVQQPLEVRRLDRLSPSVLLAIFEGVVRCVRLAPPPQGLAFGVHDGLGENADPRVFLRGVGGGIEPGEQIETQGVHDSVEVRFRPGNDRRVIDLTALRGEVKSALDAAYAARRLPSPTLGASGLAVQLAAPNERRGFVVRLPSPAEVPDGSA